MINKNLPYRPVNYLFAWAVHIFTASAACVGLLTLVKIYQQNYIQALALMAAAIVIDAVDGTFARLFRVKSVLPNIDGALLDNIVDYLNYVITPCFFLFVKPDILPSALATVVIVAIIISSAYQFCQSDAKTPDHFFKGFPCYWNVVVFYMFVFNTSPYVNACILLFLSAMVFVPIKYVYPSRLDYLTSSIFLKILMHILSIIFGVSSAWILWHYPESSPIALSLSFGYIILYLLISFYRTCHPLIKQKMS
jgi:phosphatidylcholine synthase